MLTKALELDRPTTSQCKWKCNETADIVQLWLQMIFSLSTRKLANLTPRNVSNDFSVSISAFWLFTKVSHETASFVLIVLFESGINYTLWIKQETNDICCIQNNWTLLTKSLLHRSSWTTLHSNFTETNENSTKHFFFLSQQSPALVRLKLTLSFILFDVNIFWLNTIFQCCLNDPQPLSTVYNITHTACEVYSCDWPNIKVYMNRRGTRWICQSKLNKILMITWSVNSKKIHQSLMV